MSSGEMSQVQTHWPVEKKKEENVQNILRTNYFLMVGGGLILYICFIDQE